MIWWHIFLREMAIFAVRLKRPSFVVAALVTPIMYLLVFGLGLGRQVKIEGGDYLSFLVPGLIAMTSMQNSFSWVASALNFSRFYHRTYQIMVLAPIASWNIVAGHVLAGVARGLFATLLVASAGLLAGWRPGGGALMLPALLLNCVQFAAIGVIVGMLTRHTEEHTVWANFLITPMGFFCGTFFPLTALPDWAAGFLGVLPLAPAVSGLRGGDWGSVFLLFAYCLVLLGLAGGIVKRYRE